MVDKARLISLAQELIRIDSQNPPGNEAALAHFTRAYLQKLGLAVKLFEFKKNRTNVLATLAGRNKNYSLLLTPHLDTVPAGKNWRFSPFKATVSGGKLYGLGATDCKVNIACALEAINSLVEENTVLDYNLIFAATADEECGSELGLIPLLNKGILKPDAAVVLDSDDFDIVVEQKGLLHVKISLQGKRAHGAYPWLGVNAIDLAIQILSDLKKERCAYVKNKYLKPPTLNIGTIRGGDKVNVVADWCEFELDFRYLPQMKAKEFLDRARAVCKKYTRKFRIEIQGVQKPYSIAKTHPLVSCLAQSMKKHKALSTIKGSEGATVITFFLDKQIPAVATGFGSQGCAHTVDEYVKVDNLYKGALVLEDFLSRYNKEIKWKES